MLMAHRVLYDLLVGPVPDGLVLDHFACDNPPCVRPDHVRPVTQRENLLRGDTRTARNAAKTECVHGHPLAGANLMLRPNGDRRCRACYRKSQRESSRRRRARDKAHEDGRLF